MDAALRMLDGLDGLDVDEHPRVYAAVHHALEEVLAGTRSAAPPG